MLGFPGETEADFDELMHFMAEHPFDRVGAFTYSAEDGTPAASMPNAVDAETAEQRLDRLMRQQMKKPLLTARTRNSFSAVPTPKQPMLTESSRFRIAETPFPPEVMSASKSPARIIMTSAVNWCRPLKRLCGKPAPPLKTVTEKQK